MASDCGSDCPVDGGFYSYGPNVGGNAVLLAAFALLVPVVFYTGIRFRTPAFAAVLTTGLVLEAVGFVGRMLLRGARDNQGYFVLSTLGTMLGPSFMTVAVYIVLPHVFGIYGDNLSTIPPAMVGTLFNGLMALSLVLQVVGVVAMTYVFNGITRFQGAEIAAGGLALQASSLFVVAVLYFWFTLGLHDGRFYPDPKHSPVYRSLRFNRFLRSFEVASSLLLIYSVYRVIEMATGIESGLFQSEVGFMIANGAIPFIVCILLTVFHPGAAFGQAWDPTSLRGFQRRAPPPILPGIRHETHHRYDPNIRSKFSPGSRTERSPQYPSPPPLPSGSPGLPMSPRPTHKLPSPLLPSPKSTTSTSNYSNRFSDRSERRSQAQKKLVDTEALW